MRMTTIRINVIAKQRAIDMHPIKWMIVFRRPMYKVHKPLLKRNFMMPM